MQRTVEVNSAVLRIVSLVPSQTELLVDLGLRDSLVGVTKFCIHPKDLKASVTVVGGTKNVDCEKVRALKPDLIIGNKEENEQANIRELEQIAPVWMSDIQTVDDALEMIQLLGELLNAARAASQMVQQIKLDLQELKGIFSGVHNRFYYLIWRNPYMTAGQNTFISDLLHHLGLQNAAPEDRYPIIDLQPIYSPDFIFLSSEPYPFKEIHVREIQQEHPNTKVILVDGEMLSWYGSHLLQLKSYIQAIFVPQIKISPN